MKMLKMEPSDTEFLYQIDYQEALEFLREGEEVILRSNEREFYGVNNESDLENAYTLYKQKVYSKFELYIE